MGHKIKHLWPPFAVHFNRQVTVQTSFTVTTTLTMPTENYRTPITWINKIKHNHYEGLVSMENSNKTLLALLNKEFGFPDAKAATYKKVKQFYDETKAQHIVYIELRISRGEKSVEPDTDYKRNQRLLYQIINARKTR